jgi:hypothetical protein
MPPLYINGRLQPEGAIGAVVYSGVWDAAANVPPLASGIGSKGSYYVVSVAGTTNLDGITDWQVGDWAIFNGAVWEKVDNTAPIAIRIFPPSATDPVAPTPQNGDQYFNTVLRMTMEYDSVRAKWLSVDAQTCPFGAKKDVAPGSYYGGTEGVTFSATNGYDARFNGTVVAIGYTRDDTDAVDFEITDDGATIATLASSAAKGKDNTVNADFAQDSVLAARNKSGGNTTTAIQGYFIVRWRV